ncbi:MAG: flavodoxin family protein [Methanobacteriaceae archaeon]|nr:flavodoxin family protein [Methanobacteriaceae archaeon]
MNILTIIGSPRKKGNTYQTVKELEEKMKKLGDYEFEYLYLKDSHLEDCRGCFSCISKGIEFCPLKDDLELIEEKMEEADGLILASPVYVMTVSALLKKFIDREAYLCHRPKYHGKKALVLSTTGGVGAKETMNYMEMVIKAWGYQTVDKCGIITAPWPATQNLKKKNNSILEKSAQKFSKSLKSVDNKKFDKIKVGFKDYLSFRIFQEISSDVKKYMPADYQFYQDKEYYQPAKIGILTRMLTVIILRVVFFIMRDMGPADGK